MSDKIIKTTFVGHLKDHDWLAYVDGDEEGAQGWGATEAEAIEDLKEQLDELEYTKEEGK